VLDGWRKSGFLPATDPEQRRKLLACIKSGEFNPHNDKHVDEQPQQLGEVRELLAKFETEHVLPARLPALRAAPKRARKRAQPVDVELTDSDVLSKLKASSLARKAKLSSQDGVRKRGRPKQLKVVARSQLEQPVARSKGDGAPATHKRRRNCAVDADEFAGGSGEHVDSSDSQDVFSAARAELSPSRRRRLAGRSGGDYVFY
jgi:hypothetical protein